MKIKIIKKDSIYSEKTFKENLLKFLTDRSDFKRINRSNLISEFLDDKNIIDIKEFNIESISFGSTYQGSGYRNMLSLKDATHRLKKIIFDGDDYFAQIIILDTPAGISLGGSIINIHKDFAVTNAVLIPVYTSEGDIITFDIEFIKEDDTN